MSTEYVIELLQLPVNEAFTAKPELFTELHEGVKAGGASSQAYGLAVEDSSKLYWLIHFEGGVQPADFEWPVEHGDFARKLGAISTAMPKESLFAQIKEKFPRAITAAPITETATMTLKPGVDKAEYAQLMDGMIGEFVRPAEGCHGALWAFASEDFNEVATTNRVVVFAGWDSLEAHMKLTKTEGLGECASKLVSMLAGKTISHVKYTQA